MVTLKKTLPYVSVVIPAYNEEIYLPLCLKSINKQNYPGEYEVIVVDNASTDNTAKVAINWGAKVVYESKRSPACARQKGAETAKGEIIAFIDADTQAPPYWLSTIVRRFLKEPRLVVVSGPYAYFDAGRLVKIVSYLSNFIFICLDQFFRFVFRKGGALWGSNFAVRRSALLAVGGFDTSIKFYGEEYELSLRLRKVGKGGIIPWLFVLTSARRIKKLGIITQYWNWIVDYFLVLFWNKPLPEKLEDLPVKVWQTVAAYFSWQRISLSFKYVFFLFGLIWLHMNVLIVALGKFLYAIEVAVLGFFLIFHGVNPRSKLYGKIWSNGNRNGYRIALTFDDGPNGWYTCEVLNILEKYNIKATFFVIGQNVQRYPEVCRQIVASGHTLGNHSFYHQKLLCLRSPKTIALELEQTQQLIYHYTGLQQKLFRPPYGFRTPWLVRTAKQLGYTVITWDNMTSDWKSSKSAEEITSAIVRRVKPGGIIVLHDGRGSRLDYDRSQMLQALPQIIETLKGKGFDFVTVPELLKEK